MALRLVRSFTVTTVSSPSRVSSLYNFLQFFGLQNWGALRAIPPEIQDEIMKVN